MKCPKCNEEINDGVKFCTKCGANIENTITEQKAIDDEKKLEEIRKEETKKQEETNTEEKTEKEATIENGVSEEPKKEQKVKNKIGKKKIIAIIIILILLLGGAATGTFLWMKNNKEDEEKKLEWGDIYLEVLKDDDFEEMDNMQLQLCDLDEDKVPELIVYGFKNMSDYIANIYKINKENEVDTIKVDLDENFDMEYLYNLDEEEYSWYAVTTSYSDKKVYNLNFDNEKYEPEEVEQNYDTDFVKVDEKVSQKVSLAKDAKNSEKKEAFNKAKENYVPTKDMITDSIKEKVETAKNSPRYKKIDDSKELVYSVLTKTINGKTFEYPCININSNNIKDINDEIKENYGFESNLNANNYYDQVGNETEEISYSYTENNNILSLIIWKGGNESIWADTYNINLKTVKEISLEDLIKEYGFEQSEVIEKSTATVKTEFNRIMEKEKKSFSDIWETMYGQSSVTKWESEISGYIEELHLFINDNNELCILGKYQHAGGQWSCTQTVVVNISNGYTVSELEFKDGPLTHYSDYYTPTSSQTNSSSSNGTSSSSSNSSSSSTSSSVQDIKFASSSVIVSEGTYTRSGNNTIKITNSKAGQFDFEIYCEYMLPAGYPNIGELSGTAKSTSDGNFAYVERIANGDNFDYNVIFKIADSSITIDEQYKDSWTPYCGHNVTFEGTFIKQ